MKSIVYVFVLCVLLSSCSPQNKFKKSKKEIAVINNRKSLKEEQAERKRHTTQYRAREQRQSREVTQAQQEKDAKIEEAVEKGKKRHMDFQSKETRERMKKNAKESNKKSFWD
jgi:Mg-chelatase subunit ChlI